MQSWCHCLLGDLDLHWRIFPRAYQWGSSILCNCISPDTKLVFAHTMLQARGQFHATPILNADQIIESVWALASSAVCRTSPRARLSNSRLSVRTRHIFPTGRGFPLRLVTLPIVEVSVTIRRLQEEADDPNEYVRNHRSKTIIPGTKVVVVVDTILTWYMVQPAGP